MEASRGPSSSEPVPTAPRAEALCPPTGPTGPLTTGGKAISRRNAFKHGLTANPATLGIEDADAFRSLLEQLTEELDARGALELSIVHRIAIALWRLNRAALIDGATTARSVARARPPTHGVDQYIVRFHDSFRWKRVEERDPAVLTRARAARLARPGEPWLRWKRESVRTLEHLRAEMLDSPDGLRAMVTILDRLWSAYLDGGDGMEYDDLLKLAWLLGDDADTIPALADEFDLAEDGRPGAFGQASPRAGRRFEMLRAGRSAIAGITAPPEVASMVAARRDSLLDQIAVREDPAQRHRGELDLVAGLLPDADVLDRLQRYEAAAERSLYRGIEALAKLRGSKTEVIRLTIAGAMTNRCQSLG